MPDKSKSLDMLDLLLVTLHFLIGLPEIKAIIRGSSLPVYVQGFVSEARRAAEKKKAAKARREAEAEAGEGKGEDVVGDDGKADGGYEGESEDMAGARDDEDMEDDPSAVPNEPEGDHIFRCFRSLTAWHTAAVVVVAHLQRVGKSPTATIVRLADHSSDAVNDLRENHETVVDAILRRIDERVVDVVERSSATEWVKDQARLKVLKTGRFRVHAEAGLMALANVANSGQDAERIPEVVRTISMNDPLPIGVSKNTSLFDRQGRANSQFHLPGTHGLILPWDPPPFGMTVPVLEALVEKLMEQVLHHAEIIGRRLADESRQSSPQSVRSEEGESSALYHGMDGYSIAAEWSRSRSGRRDVALPDAMLTYSDTHGAGR
ncbi:hypothetical protein C8T65DRAFT_671541 [Cerioporus squamosus]|nr:hypothetical protein C8T65DRAFT_671541 [Cerioporus squamosus]